MAKKPILVVMAAGMGSRYGGLKQIDPVGSQGEAILDFSLFDAHEAGFETAVIIIKEAIRKDFMETVGKRLEKCPMEIRYAYQELDKLPEGYTVPAGRTKPWGTCHAVLCAKDVIGDAPFAVINADDYYGKSAYRVIYDALCKAQDGEKYDYCMVGYLLGNTVTDNGSVARGVCQADDKGNLTQIVERTRIEKYDGGIHFTEDGENWEDLTADTIVSMNMWGYTPSFLGELEARFPNFLDTLAVKNPEKAEYFLPLAVDELIRDNKATVKVLSSPDKWFGVTYAADKPMVVAALREKTAEGLYPDGLWKKAMKISFSKNGNWREKMRRAFILRFDAKADFIQEEDAVADPLDDRFNGRYAYLTALTNETFQNGTEAALRCSFEGTGAPILMFVEDARTDADGDFRYAACVEVVIWQHGVNVWRYTRNEGDIRYYHAMADFSPLAEKEIHDLRVKVDGNWLLIRVDDKCSSVCIPDMPEVFQVGAAVCEGENRLYDLEINESNSFENFMTWGAYRVPIQK